jgi:hypothetical protein
MFLITLRAADNFFGLWHILCAIYNKSIICTMPSKKNVISSNSSPARRPASASVSSPAAVSPSTSPPDLAISPLSDLPPSTAPLAVPGVEDRDVPAPSPLPVLAPGADVARVDPVGPDAAVAVDAQAQDSIELVAASAHSAPLVGEHTALSVEIPVRAPEGVTAENLSAPSQPDVSVKDDADLESMSNFELQSL